MRVINLGWGVQSFTLVAMVALGELEPVDVALHADTTHEFSGTYEFAKKWTPWLENRGVRVVTVFNPRPNALDNGWGWIDMPTFSISPDGHIGQSQRQCTSQWKILPMRRWLQSNRNRESIEQWIGISLDEFQRMKESDVKYITHRWPLIEKKMTRADCVKWLEAHSLEIPPRSACVFCPFHNTAEWRKIKASKPDWEEAVRVDNAIRNVQDRRLFIHPSRKPLEKVDFRTAEEKGQLSLWDNECSGICGV